LLDGLEGAAAGSGGRFDRGAMEQTLAGLGSRVFLMNNVHDDAPVIFETRWVMSYLRGPLTRQQIKSLMDPVKAASAPASAAPQRPASRSVSVASAASSNAAAPAPLSPPSSGTTARPVLPPDIAQAFVPVRSNPPAAGAALVYEPMLLGCAHVYFVDAKNGVDQQDDVCILAPLRDGVAAAAAHWAEGADVDWDETELESGPATDVVGAAPTFAPPPAAAGKAKNYDTWKKQLADALYRGRELELFRSPTMKLTSRGGESERDFRVRVQQLAREERDAEVGKLRDRYTPKVVALSERIRRAQQAVAREREQANASKVNTAISIGGTILGALFGRKAVSAGTVGRATTAARGASRTYKESQDVARAGDTVEALQQQQADLQAQFDAEAAQIAAAETEIQSEVLETVSVKPKKTNVSVRLVTLAWAPHWQVGEDLTPAY
jgi:hypothetical protein